MKDNGNGSTPDDSTETFDLTLSDVRPDEMAALAGGLSLVVVQAKQMEQAGQVDDADERIAQIEDLTIKLFTENREATRHLILESDISTQIRVEPGSLPLDELGLAVEDGELVDAED